MKCEGDCGYFITKNSNANKPEKDQICSRNLKSSKSEKTSSNECIATGNDFDKIKAEQKSHWEEIQNILKNIPYVLDIDLDYFSTMDPFKNQYSEEQYRLIKEIYRFEKPLNNTDEVN